MAFPRRHAMVRRRERGRAAAPRLSIRYTIRPMVSPEVVVVALNGSVEAEPRAGIGDGSRVGDPGLEGDDGTTT